MQQHLRRLAAAMKGPAGTLPMSRPAPRRSEGRPLENASWSARRPGPVGGQADRPATGRVGKSADESAPHVPGRVRGRLEDQRLAAKIAIEIGQRELHSLDRGRPGIQASSTARWFWPTVAGEMRTRGASA